MDAEVIGYSDLRDNDTELKRNASDLNSLRGDIEMAPQSTKRNRLIPWYIGLVVILASVIFVGYRMLSNECAQISVELGVLVVVPLVYLILMYLTLVSQE
jgi:hypothetical protein